MDLVKPDNYDTISDNVRRFCADKLGALEEALRPYVNGDFNDIQPGHAAAYIATLKELGRLYQVHQRPRDPDDMIPAAEVDKMLAVAEARMAVAVAEAVEATEARIRGELEAARGSSLQVARAQVESKLRGLGR